MVPMSLDFVNTCNHSDSTGVNAVKTRPKQKRKPIAAAKKAAPKGKAKAGGDLNGAYTKYFTSPALTPTSFRIFDLTDGAGFSTSTHT